MVPIDKKDSGRLVYCQCIDVSFKETSILLIF